MIHLNINPIPTDIARSYWEGAVDAHGMKPERKISEGTGVPCRHCLNSVSKGDPYLILAYCPFSDLQPYAEIGPIFLHANPCNAYSQNASMPSDYLNGKPRIVRGYDRNNRIIYGTGKIVPPAEIIGYAGELLENLSVDYVHVRSAENNCYTFRIDRAS